MRGAVIDMGLPVIPDDDIGISIIVKVRGQEVHAEIGMWFSHDGECCVRSGGPSRGFCSQEEIHPPRTFSILR